MWKIDFPDMKPFLRILLPAAVQAKLLGYLSGVYALPALMLAAEYLTSE